MDFGDLDDMSGDMNFGELEDIDGNDRSPSKIGVAKDLAKEAGTGFLDSLVRKTASKSLPEEYSTHYSDAMDYADGLRLAGPIVKLSFAMVSKSQRMTDAKPLRQQPRVTCSWARTASLVRSPPARAASSTARVPAIPRPESSA